MLKWVRKIRGARSCALLAVFAISLIFSLPSHGTPPGNPPAATSQGFDLTAIDPRARTLALKAIMLDEAGNRQRALTLLRNAEAAAPNDWRVHVLLGRAMLQMQYPASAEREFRAARQHNAQDEYVLPWLFQSMLARQEAQTLLDEFPDPQPGADKVVAALILQGRAEALMALGAQDKAASEMDSSLALKRSALGLVTRAQIATKQGNPALAKSLIDEAVRQDPKNRHVLSAELAELMDTKDYTAAFALTDQLLKQYPRDRSLHAARIEIYLSRNQDGKAAEEAKTLQTQWPGQPLGVYYKSVLLMRAHDARSAWTNAAGLSPDFINSQPSYALAVAEMAIRGGSVRAGSHILDVALSKSPQSAELRARIASLRMDWNDPAGALDVLAPVKDRQDVGVLIPMAQAYIELGKIEDALPLTKLVEKLAPQSSIALLRYAVWAAPSSPDFADALGISLLQQKDAKGADAQLTRAHGLRPADGEITFHLVEALDANGNHAGARTLLKSLLSSHAIFDDSARAQKLASDWHFSG